MEDMSDDINKYRDQKAAENAAKLIEHFRDEVESHGGRIDLVVLSGNRVRLRISDQLPDDLKRRISEYHSQFYNWPPDP